MLGRHQGSFSERYLMHYEHSSIITEHSLIIAGIILSLLSAHQRLLGTE
jgi:hypothetical protein